MADRDRTDPEQRRDPAETLLTAPLRTEPPSMPTRVPLDTSRTASAATTMIPMTRRRVAPRRGLRPVGTAKPSAPDAEASDAPQTPQATQARPNAGEDASSASPTTEQSAPPAATMPTTPVATALAAVATGGVDPSAPTTKNPAVPVRTGIPGTTMPPAPARPRPPERSAPNPSAPNPSAPKPPAPTAISPAAELEPSAVASLPAAASAPASPPPAPCPPASPPPAPSPPASPPPAPSTTVRPHDVNFAATSSMVGRGRERLAGWRRGWTWLRTGKTLAATIAVLVFLTTGLAWAGLEKAVREIGALDPNSSAIRDADAQRGDQNYLIVGSDTRIGVAPAEDAGDAADVPGARADTVMVVHVPEDRSRVTVVAFPRDLEISRPACEHWDPVSGQYSPQTVPRTPEVKLNSAYAAGGPRCVTRVVQELSGLAINHFLGVDFQGFKGMVDAVKGVPICVERPIKDSILGTVIPRAGPTTLSGDQALNFVRARHVVGDPSSDYGRIQRQQRFLSSLLRTTLSAGTMLDPGKLQNFVNAVTRSTFGENVGPEQLLGLGQSLGDLNPATVTFTTVPTTGSANSRGNEVLRAAADRDLFGAIIDNHPLAGAPPAPGAPPGPPSPPIAPQQVTVHLVDDRGRSGSGSASGSGTTTSQGVADDAKDTTGSSDGSSTSAAGTSATKVAASLRAAGFTVVPDSAGSNRAGAEPRTTVRFSPDQGPAASLLGRTVPGAALDPGAPGPGTLVLSLGNDFDGRIGRDTAPPAPVVPTITGADARCS